MPELPEVEAARCLVESHCLGKNIEQIDVVIEDEIIFGMCKDEIYPLLSSALVNQELNSVGRKGKYFWLSFGGGGSNGDTGTVHLLIHFGMTGFIQAKGVERSFYMFAPEKASQPQIWPPKFTRLILHFSGGVEFAFGDSRRLGRIRIVRGPIEEFESVKNLGFDPILSLKGHFSEFSKECLKRRVPIKSLLLDQSFTAGVGNWMADDILLLARIHPNTIASSLSPEQVKSLYSSCIELSEKAVEYKHSGKDYPKEWLFHIRKDRKVDKTLTGIKASSARIGGRTTIFVPSVQKAPATSSEKHG